MTQIEQVIEAMRENGGYATFEQLNRMIDFSSWKTKTPQASVRRIVQVNDAFFRIQPGLWALKDYENDIMQKFDIKKDDEKSKNAFTHSYYQGLLIEIGNISGYQTYVPNQDRKHLFLETPLGDMSTVESIPAFTYTEIVKRAKTIDTIWFNERNLPHSFFEVEHSTDIQNSLAKYYELQDFSARFCIVAPKHRKNQFEDLIGRSIFRSIQDRVVFMSYEDVAYKYEHAAIVSEFRYGGKVI